LRQLVLNLE
jgi:hypothetical protein